LASLRCFPLKKYSKGLEEDREEELEYPVKGNAGTLFPLGEWDREYALEDTRGEWLPRELFRLQKMPREN
jgi:hypothetical protein